MEGERGIQRREVRAFKESIILMCQASVNRVCGNVGVYSAI